MDTAKQTQMAFMLDEGGLSDDGTTVDPVSGNEVPPGSLAKEVRDDVPAQLSEGEYVVPADVVRYFGVKFFEDLRNAAKGGMMEMEANGRIGGEPVAMTVANQTGGELSPEELAAVEQATGMALGGVVRAADGTDVTTNPAMQPQFTAQTGSSMFAPGYLSQNIINQAQGTEQRTVFLYPPDGGAPVQVTLPVEQAKYDDLKAQGYTENPVEVKTEARASRDDGGPSAPPPQQQEYDIDLEGSTSEDLTKVAKSMGIMSSVAKAFSGLTGTPVGMIINTGLVAKYNDIIEELDSRGANTEGLERRGSIFGGESSLYENLGDTSGDGNVNFGDTWLGDLLGFDGESGVQGPGLRDSFGGSRRTGGGDDDKPSFAGDNNNDTSSGATAAQVNSATQTSQAANADTDYTPGTDQFDNEVEYDANFYNQGGMVKRPSKKKKK